MPAEKHKKTIDDAVAHQVARAANARGLTAEELRPRIVKALDKYLFGANPAADHAEIRGFIDEIHTDDLCLILACESGDENAWEHLVANYDGTVKSAARKIAASSEEADDLASSIWAELYGLREDAEGNRKSKLAYYSGRGSLAGWLRAVVSQLAVDQFRKNARMVQIEEAREFEILAEESSNNSNNEHVVSHAENPEELLTEKESSRDVAETLSAAIDELEAEDRLILKMYYFDDLKLKDIAAVFGYHEATASRKLVRVQSDIRKSVEKALRTRHGWSDGEVKRHLSETAAGLGISLEKMFAILMTAAVMQDIVLQNVL
jgi:RNA polymerase sigma-70 factor (ECF subfamily)